MVRLSGFSDEISTEITKQFEVLNKLGIKYFEPRGVNGKNISALNEAETCELKQKMSEYGIKVSSIGSPIGKIKITDDFEKHFEVFKNVVRVARDLDVKFIRIFSFYHESDEWTKAERDEVFSRLGKMIDYARKNDVVLLHENEKGIYGDIASRCAEIMQELYCDNFKAVFDPANFVQCGEKPRVAFDLLKPYVEYMHIKDALADSGKVVPSGMGDSGMEYILSGLFERGYDGFLSLEPHLGSFEGLKDLELCDVSDLPEGGEGTFMLAHSALKKILDKLGEKYE